MTTNQFKVGDTVKVNHDALAQNWGCEKLDHLFPFFWSKEADEWFKNINLFVVSGVRDSGSHRELLELTPV